MTAPAPHYSLPGRPDRACWRAAAGFLIILLIAVLPLNGAELWVDLPHQLRRPYTDAFFAVLAMATAGIMLSRGFAPRLPLHLIVAAGVFVVAGQACGVWAAFHYVPGQDKYLSDGTFVLGSLAIAVLAATDLLGGVLDRRRHS